MSAAAHAWPLWPLSANNPGWDAASGRLDAAKLLGSDTESCRAPQANAARVLEELQERLARERPLQGAERGFLALLAETQTHAPAQLAEIWLDPRACFWTHVAHDLLGVCSGGAPHSPSTAAWCAARGEVVPARALARHLGEFAPFALAAAFRAGLERRLATPVRVPLPFALPGTRWCLEGDGEIDLLGIGDAELQLRRGVETLVVSLVPGRRFRAAGLVARECPVVRVRGHELWLHPYALAVPGWKLAEPSVAAGLDYHERHAPLAQQTLEHVARFAPELFEHFRRTIRLIAFKPRAAGGFDDFSNPELPGSFVASVVENPLELADHFIHELQHNRLSCIEESGALFEATPGGSAGPGYYSPWRDEPRSLYGVFHGVFVFCAVQRYWRGVYEAGALDGDARGYVVDRLLRLPLQLALAVGMLERHARLTPLSRVLLAQLARDVAEICRESYALDLPPDAPAWRALETGGYARERSRVDSRPLRVGEALREHVERHPAGRQCDDLLARLEQEREAARAR